MMELVASLVLILLSSFPRHVSSIHYGRRTKVFPHYYSTEVAGNTNMIPHTTTVPSTYPPIQLILRAGGIRINHDYKTRQNNNGGGMLDHHHHLTALFTANYSYAVHIGLVIVAMECAAPVLIAMTEFVGKMLVVGLSNVMEYTTHYVPSLIKYAIYHRVLNSNSSINSDDDDDRNRIFEIRDYENNKYAVTYVDPKFPGSEPQTYRGVVLTRKWQAIFYFVSTWIEIPRNDPYSHRNRPKTMSSGGIIKAITARYINKRKLVVLGACARALQICTSIEYIFNPSVGVCAMLNVGAVWPNFRWVRNFINGWTLSAEMWRIVGAKKPEGREKYDGKKKK